MSVVSSKRGLLAATTLIIGAAGLGPGSPGYHLVQATTEGRPAAAATTIWPTYHLTKSRSGNDTGEPSFLGLKSAWNTNALDGLMLAEPLVDNNMVIVATENNSLYAFDVKTGSPRWGPVSLGAPRTTGHPCNLIIQNPLGITSTPVIDRGFLYAVAEVQTSSTTYEFHLAKVDPSTGAVAYNKNITPSGMDPYFAHQRSALAISQGNVVITWGGLNGDCGNYHGYIETVSEASGAEQQQWNDTSEPGGTLGGMWAASGPAVDGSGNIYVSTGNSSSTDINNYDYGDSVLTFSPALVLRSWFAPGPPQSWIGLNSTDGDLGSTGPSLLPNGLLFAIGKGGRGYLLNQSTLPDNSNPGGGENFSAQVCTATKDAAFGGLALSGGNTVYVPCSDGIAAERVDSANAFHTLWYQKSGGGSAPILAGGLVWTAKMFGGTTLYGLSPSTGQILSTLTLPGATAHFVTPSAGDGTLFVGAGTRLAAFTPAPRITTPSPLPSGTVNTRYPATTLQAGGGATPYSWSISSGVFPSGLSLSSAGTIDGTPQETGTVTFTAMVVDNNGTSATKPLSITINGESRRPSP